MTLPTRVARDETRLGGPRHVVVHWYRVVHPVGVGDAQPLAVYLPRFLPGIGYVDFYVDGAPVDVPAARAANHWNQPMLFRVPPRLSADRASIEVLAAVSFDARSAYGLAAPWIGPEATLARAAGIRHYLQSGAPEALSYAFLVLGLFAFGFWLRRPQETPYLLFALATVVWYLRTLHFHVDVVPFDGLTFWWLTSNSMSWLMLLVHQFALRIQGQRARWAEWTLWALVIVAGLATLPAIGVEPALAGTVTYVAQVFVALALWLNIAFGIYDLLLKEALLDPRGIFLLPYGAVFLFGAFRYAVLRRYTAAIDGVERLNASLEERLAARTRELNASHDRLRAIEREQTLADERRRLMRDMHDGLGSSLMSSLVMVEQGRLAPTEVAQVLRECIDDLKLTIDSLEPIGADLVTLLATLRYRLGRRLEAAGLKLDWCVADLPPLPWLDALAALEVLRILQEALTNVIKHASAGSVAISTWHDGNEVFVRIEDDGHGFEVADARRAATGRGLLNLERRAAKLGGRVDLVSTPAGTVLELVLCVERRSADEPVAPDADRRKAGGTAALDEHRA